ncbi:Sua5/YciO/YrdC/YwlC family tRNA threonylcarbamoyl adenosine modification protein [Batrachochytrium salamandrivorans]|nr:Sua5/YciO/YrdC/YwlC family tRNA threonylcarbamoyl adenosine modification protein [Batrachochytrium salamandrivorans]
MDTFIVKVDPSALAVELGLNRNTQPTNTGTSTQSSIAHGAKPTPNVPDDSSRQSRFRSETAKLDEAVNILQAGGVVAFPTETVYGLGANALDATAVSRIFTAKSRPSDNPLIVHVSSIAMLESLLPASAPSLPPIYAALVARFWPGPLTILVPRGDHVPNIITAGHATVAVRMPSHPS